MIFNNQYRYTFFMSCVNGVWFFTTFAARKNYINEYYYLTLHEINASNSCHAIHDAADDNTRNRNKNPNHKYFHYKYHCCRRIWRLQL